MRFGCTGIGACVGACAKACTGCGSGNKKVEGVTGRVMGTGEIGEAGENERREARLIGVGVGSEDQSMEDGDEESGGGERIFSRIE